MSMIICHQPAVKKLAARPRRHAKLVLSNHEAVFSPISDPRKARGVRHLFAGIVSLVFLGLLARITEMAVVVRRA